MAKWEPRNNIVKYLPEGICAEVGVALGDYSKIILDNSNPVELYLIDSWENFDLGYPDGNMVTQEEHDRRYNYVVDRFKTHSNVKIVRKRSQEGLLGFPNNFFDWVYIDADHSFEGCLKDLESAHLKIKIDGYICGHDFLADGFTVEGFGVNEAVLQFIEKYNYKMIFLTSDKCYKSYVLCKTDNAAESFNNKLNSLNQ
jgi:Methyltransferase domain